MASTTATTATKVPALVTTPLIVVTAVFPVLSLASILLRNKARRLARQSFHLDGYLIVLSWVKKTL